ncbi:hypothetical protein Tco_1520295 [Tanacetum coccineum]
MERITIKEYKIGSEVFDLLKIDLDLFTYDTPLGTIFDEFRRLSRMEDDLMSWESLRIFISHSFQFKIGDIEWPTCNSNEDGYCNGGNLPGIIRVGNMTYLQNYEWYEGLEDGDLKNEALKEKAILEGSLGHENEEGSLG